ncbi:hypothetical protein [Natronomonas sp.]|uniref:hypothetical protein n=1 Tax=Natronomonas sp. TaxID=2184060 RepID=UPI002FC28D45
MSDGWVGAVGVVGIAVVVLVGAALLTPGQPDCVAYSAAGRLRCPWYRTFLRNAVLLAGVITGGLVVVGVPIGLLRGLLGARR